MKALKFLILCVLVLGCKKDDPPSPPGSVSLVAPAKNTECSPIDSSSGNTNLVQFSWQAASNAESYLLQVSNLVSGTTQSVSTEALTEIVPVTQGTPFSWSVTARNTKVTETSVSETWLFYSPGTELTYVPFPAQVVLPDGPKSFIDENGEITLSWTGLDFDDNIESYDIYYSTANPPTLLSTLSNSETSLKAAATADTVYYWKIVSKDADGNASDTGVLSFTAI